MKKPVCDKCGIDIVSMESDPKKKWTPAISVGRWYSFSKKYWEQQQLDLCSDCMQLFWTILTDKK